MFIKPVINFESLTDTRADAEPRMEDHESDGPEYQEDEEEEDEDDEPVHDLTGGGALSSVQPPAATAAPRLYNAPRECAIRMPTGKAANPRARGPITPATGPGQASTRFCNLAEALLATSDIWQQSCKVSQFVLCPAAPQSPERRGPQTGRPGPTNW